MVLNNLFYLLLNAFRIYVMYRFIGLFFDRDSIKPWVVWAYAAYFAINSSMYLLLESAIINIIVNVICLFLIIMTGYRGSIKRKLLSIAINHGMGNLSENIAWVIFVKGRSNQMEEFGFFFSVFILFFLETLIEKTIKLRKSIDVSFYKELFLIFISLGSMFIANIMIEGNYHNMILLVISLGILFMINISVFYFYEKVLNDYVKQKEEDMYKLQLTMYQNQLEMMQSANDAYRIMRHDMKHHMILLSDYIKRQENDNAIKYLEKMNYYINNDTQYVNTGNEEIDSIFNYVIGEIRKIDGNIETDIKIPRALPIEDFDINVILSNLLLNAKEAIRQCDRKEIAAVMRYDRGILKILIRNTYNGTVRRGTEGYISTKHDQKEHGIGLVSVKKTVAKYDGTMNIDYNDEEFKVDIFIYLDDQKEKA